MLKVNNEDGKNLVLIVPSDTSGCSHVRLRYYHDIINANPNLGLSAMILPTMVFDASLLARTRTMIFQKPISPGMIEIIRRYRAYADKFKFNLVFEIDDLNVKSPFSDEVVSVPEYNVSRFSRTPQAWAEIERSVATILPMFDVVSVSTDYMKKVYQTKYRLSNVVTVKNTVPRFLWQAPRKEHIKENIKKPKLIYTGSMCHYRNEIKQDPNDPNTKVIPAHPGDWEGVVKDWIIEQVKANKIDFTIMGAYPYFFECIRPYVKHVPWTNALNYPRFVMEEHADFQYAPLVSNEFNKCKSALRLYESAISGIVFMGNVFDGNPDSPYEEAHPLCKVPEHITKEDFDKQFWNLCKKDNYNAVLDWQYDYLDKGGHILESDAAMNRFLSICDNKNKTLKNI